MDFENQNYVIGTVKQLVKNKQTENFINVILNVKTNESRIVASIDCAKVNILNDSKFQSIKNSLLNLLSKQINKNNTTKIAKTVQSIANYDGDVFLYVGSKLKLFVSKNSKEIILHDN